MYNIFMRTTKLVLKKLQKEKSDRARSLSDRLGVADQFISEANKIVKG